VNFNNQTLVILGLGSNLGDRALHLSKAINLLTGTVLTQPKTSSVIETPALLLPGSPSEWDMPFLNMAVKGWSHFTPSELLAKTQYIEQQISHRAKERWSPREIDIDILAYGQELINDGDLSIPHKALTERIFALKPFAELWPHWSHPLFNKTAQELLEELLILA
jgi:2-amino-4-hydroxy-6-hydroxymethyldihydropteridine diphosphokinase/dihydropteroate synthase